MAEVAKEVPQKPHPVAPPAPVEKPVPAVSASQVVNLIKVGARVSLDELREFVAQSDAFDGDCEVEITSWKVDPSVSGRVDQSWETTMRVEWSVA